MASTSSFLSIVFNSFAVDVRIKRLLFENSTVPSSTKKFFSVSSVILIMPGLHSANISFKLMQQLGGGSVIGPMLIGSKHPFQIVQMGAQVNDIVNAAAMAVYETL